MEDASHLDAIAFGIPDTPPALAGVRKGPSLVAQGANGLRSLDEGQ